VAIAEKRLIITASDTKLSFSGEYSAEGLVKVAPFHGEWIAMIAGSDITQADSILEKAKKLLHGKSDDTLEVKNGFKAAYQDHFKECIEDELLSRFDMTMPEFKKNGRKQLNPEIFADLSFQVKNFKVGCSFLIHGFDEQGKPRIFTVTNPGKIQNYDRLGYWAIGLGARSALYTLATLRQSPAKSTKAQTMYNVLAAKYTSESASDVGADTFFFAKERGTNSLIIPVDFEPEIRRLWESQGKPKTLQEAVDFIDKSSVRFQFKPLD
jgi:hypothetical protein